MQAVWQFLCLYYSIQLYWIVFMSYNSANIGSILNIGTTWQLGFLKCVEKENHK